MIILVPLMLAVLFVVKCCNCEDARDLNGKKLSDSERDALFVARFDMLYTSCVYLMVIGGLIVTAIFIIGGIKSGQ